MPVIHVVRQALPGWDGTVGPSLAGGSPARMAVSKHTGRDQVCPSNVTTRCARCRPVSCASWAGTPPFEKAPGGTTTSILNVLDVGTGFVRTVRRHYASTVAIALGNTGTKSPAQTMFPNCLATPVFAKVAFAIVHQVRGRNDAHVGWRDASAVGIGLAALDVGTSSRMCAACWRSIRASIRYAVCAALTAACGATKLTSGDLQ